MDSTGGDLTHAAEQVEANIEKRSLHSSSSDHVRPSEDDLVEEKSPRHIHRSETSSENSAEVEKLDSRIVKVRGTDGDEAFDHLPEHEKNIVKRQLDIPPVKVTFRTLYRYATTNDLLILALSAICAIIGGAVMPLMTVRTALRYVLRLWY